MANQRWTPGSSSKTQGKTSGLGSILDDLLDSDVSKPAEKPAGKTSAGKPVPKASVFDESFYSSLAAEADDSEVSDADPREMARSLGGLDDLDDDILGTLGSTKKSKTPPSKPSTPVSKPTTPVSSKPTTPASKPTTPFTSSLTAAGAVDKASVSTSFKPPSSSGKFDIKELLPSPEESANETSIFGEDKKSAIEKPKEERSKNINTPPAKKSLEFGAFDDDDPLAGLDLSDDDDDERASKLQKKPSAKPETVPAVTRPPTSSGSRPVEREESLPIKSRIAGKSGKEQDNEKDTQRDDEKDTQSWDSPEENGVVAGVPQKTNAEPVAVIATKPALKKSDTVFSDDDLDLGIDERPLSAKVKSSDEKGAKNIMDSLLGKDTVSKHLQKPGSAATREFTLDPKYTSSKPKAPSASQDLTDRLDAASSKKSALQDDEEDIFGSYVPTAITSRPGTGRSVRFEDEEPNLKQLSSSLTDGGLSDSKSEKKRPLGLASSAEFSSKNTDDWLDMAASQPRPKTNPEKVSDKKPPRTPDAHLKAVKKADDDWLAALTAKVDEDEPVLKPKILSRQSSVDSSASGGKAALPKSGKTPDWLGLGDDQLIEAKTSLITRQSSLTSPTERQQGSRRNSADWLGLEASAGTGPDLDDLIGSAKGRVTLKQKDTERLLKDDEPAKSHSLGKLKERADERSLDIFSESPSPATRMPWDKDLPTSKPLAKKPDLGDSVAASVRVGTALSDQSNSAALANSAGNILPAGRDPQASMFQAGATVTSLADQQRTMWEKEQQTLLELQKAQLAEMQQQQMEMMKANQKQQELAFEQRKKMQEDALKLQQQQMASMSVVVPSPYFPTGLTPNQQSEIQLQNVELEGKVRRLEHEKSHLQSLLESVKLRHAEEIQALEISSRNRLQLTEEMNQRRDAKLREEIDYLNSESLSKLKMMEEEKSSLLSAHYRKLQDMELLKNKEIDMLRDQQRVSIERLKQDHEEALNRLKRVKDMELEAIAVTQSNPGTIQHLMEQMKQQATGLTQIQVKLSSQQGRVLDEREMSMTARDHQLKVLQECLLKQQEDNDKERTRLQELIARMEIQLREQERQLHQEKWSVSQEKSKLAALQMSVEQEKSLLTDQLVRERSELSRAKDSFMAEQRNAIVHLAEERRLLAEERVQLSVSQRIAAEKESHETLRHSQGAAQYEGLIKGLEIERDRLATRSDKVREEEERVAGDKSALALEKDKILNEQNRLGELAAKIQKEMSQIEKFSAECVEKNREGTHALAEARRLNSSQTSRLQEIQNRLTELQQLEKSVAQERLELAHERKQTEALRSLQLCSACKQHVKRNPQFTFTTPLLRAPNLSSIGVVFPQPLDLADPAVIRYKLQVERDKEFLNEESAYLEALKYSTYHKQDVHLDS